MFIFQSGYSNAIRSCKRNNCLSFDLTFIASHILSLDGSPTLRSYKAKRLKKEQSEFFSFDLVSQHIDPDAIMSASLRLFQVRSAEIPHGGRQKVCLKYSFSQRHIKKCRR